MKKVTLLGLATLLFISTFVSVVSGQNEQTVSMTGVVETNLTPQGSSSSTSKITSVSLNTFQYSVDGDSLHISGLLEYNGEQFPINRKGQIMHSKFVDTDLIVEFGETLANAENQIIVAQAAFRKDADNEIVFNEVNKGKDILQLVLFNTNNNDLIKLEQAIDSIPKYKNKELDTVIHDFYETKIFKPLSVSHENISSTKDETANNQINAAEIEERSYCNNYTTHSQCVDYYVRLDYPTVITSNGYLDGILNITDKYTVHSNGYISDGSDVLLGKDNNLIKTRLILTQGLSGDLKDYTTQGRWGIQRGGVKIFSDSESFENPNAQTNSAAAKYTLQLMNALGDWISEETQPVSGGAYVPFQPSSGYIYDADIELPNGYHLWKKDDYLETDFRVVSRGPGNGYNRIARMDWTIPFFAPSDQASRPSGTQSITIQALYSPVQ